MNLIIDQDMMENYKFVWYLHGTYLNHIFHLKKNQGRIRFKFKSSLSPET